MKLGKLPARFDSRTLRLAHYLAGYVPPPLADHTCGVKSWGMMLNGPNQYSGTGSAYIDQGLGDCTIAACAHAVQVLTMGNASSRFEITIPDSTILSAYENWCGFSPSDPSTDQGGNELDVLNAWKAGKLANHVLLGYVDPQPQNWSHVAHAIAEFGGLYIGLQLPQSAMDQFNAGEIWDVVANDGGIIGGHAVYCPAYHTEDPTANKATTITCITWGQLQKMTEAFWEKYCDESHCLLGAAWQPEGVNLPAMRADLASVSN